MAPFTAVADVYGGSELLLAAVGCVMVLVGHCTLNDCAIAGIPATSTNTDRYRAVRAFLLDINFPPREGRVAAIFGTCATHAVRQQSDPNGIPYLSQSKEARRVVCIDVDFVVLSAC